MLAGVYLLTMFRPDMKGKNSLGDHASNYTSIDDMIHGSQRQIIAPWRNYRRSVSSISSGGGDREGLLGSAGNGGSEVELTSLNGHGTVTDRPESGATTDELRVTQLQK